MFEFLYRQHICPVWWTSVSTDDWNSNCAPPLSDVHLHAIKQTYLKSFKYLVHVYIYKDIKWSQLFKFRFRYIFVLSKVWFIHCVHLIYTNKLEVNNTTDTEKSASFPDLQVDIENLKQNKRQTWWLSFSISQLPIHH